jgi:hypothetical protein
MRSLTETLLLAIAAISLSVTSQAQNFFPPSGPLALNLAGQGLPSGYTPYSTSFVASGSTSVITFVFRHDPGWFAFDDASVSTGGGSNLLVNPGFETNSLGGWAYFSQNGVTHTGFVGNASSVVGLIPWHPPVFDGSFDWLDGSTGGYDGITQTIATTAGLTYQISFELNQQLTESVVATKFQETSTNGQSGVLGNGIDVLVYAGNATPSTDPNSNLHSTPEPMTLSLLGGSLIGLSILRRRRRC